MKFIIKAFLSLFLIIWTVAYAADTASILPPAKTTFLDQNGKPLTSGSVEFFIPGTSTHKTTWQDTAETIPNLNPVILDNAGRALILGSGAYRQVVKDRNNLQQWDQVTSSLGSGGGSSGNVGDGNAVGTVLAWSGLTTPSSRYAFSYGQELSRVTFSTLLATLTQTQNITCISGNATLNSIIDTTQLNIGTAVEAACVPAGSTIISKTATTVTLNNNAIVSTTVAAIFYPWGNGNGVSTFNAPDLRGYVLPGRCNMGGSDCSIISNPTYTDPNALGGIGGNQSTLVLQVNLPNVNFTVASGQTVSTSSTTTDFFSAPSGVADAQTVVGTPNNRLASGSTAFRGAVTGTGTVTNTGTASSGGSGTAIRTIQPSKTINYIIKVLPDINLAIAKCSDLSDAGTACTFNVGTSGANIPLLNTANAYSALQTFTNGVAISGGATSITNLNAPLNPTDAATKSYVDSVATGLNILPQTTLATVTVLPNTPTYANGALGVGATLTAGSNTTLTVDGTAAPLNTVVLVKNQTSTFQNGVYTVTTAGSGAAAWVLTRVTYFDQAAEMKAGSYTFITNGATNLGSAFTLQNAVTTVGTDALTLVLFSAVGGNVIGPVSSTDNSAARYDGATGKLIQGSALVIDDTTAALSRSGGGGIPIQGVNSATSATAGNVGELISALVPFASRFGIANSVLTEITRVSLTPGDWDCTSVAGFETSGGAFPSEYHVQISTTAPPTVVTAPNSGGSTGTHNNYKANQGQAFSAGPIQILISVNPTNVYLAGLSTFGTDGINGAGAQTTYGFLRCRRMQ